MDDRTVQIELCFADGCFTGRVVGDDDAPMFTGMLGLIAAIDALLEAPVPGVDEPAA